MNNIIKIPGTLDNFDEAVECLKRDGASFLVVQFRAEDSVEGFYCRTDGEWHKQEVADVEGGLISALNLLITQPHTT